MRLRIIWNTNYFYMWILVCGHTLLIPALYVCTTEQLSWGKDPWLGKKWDIYYLPPSRKVMLIPVLTSRSLDPLLAEGAVDCWRVSTMEEGHICPPVSSLQEGWLSCILKVRATLVQSSQSNPHPSPGPSTGSFHHSRPGVPTSPIGPERSASFCSSRFCSQAWRSIQV